MTDTQQSDRDASTLSDVNHTHPYDDGHASTRLFGRGPRVETDGGERVGDPRSSADGTSAGGPHSGTPTLSENGTAVPERRPPKPTLADVSHTPPHGDDANRVWTRGPVERE